MTKRTNPPIDLSLEPPSSHALIDEVARELRQVAEQFRNRDFSNYDCAEVLDEWVNSLFPAKEAESTGQP